jgi:hypothetical protein
MTTKKKTTTRLRKKPSKGRSSGANDARIAKRIRALQQLAADMAMTGDHDASVWEALELFHAFLSIADAKDRRRAVRFVQDLATRNEDA